MATTKLAACSDCEANGTILRVSASTRKIGAVSCSTCEGNGYLMSSDGGLTWQPIRQNLTGRLLNIPPIELRNAA